MKPLGIQTTTSLGYKESTYGFDCGGARPGPEYAIRPRARTRRPGDLPLVPHTGSKHDEPGVSAGAEWRCVQCGSRWDAVRLATVAAYEGWLATRAPSPVDPAPHAVKAADTILFGKYSGQEVRVDGVEYLTMKEDDVLAVQERSL